MQPVNFPGAKFIKSNGEENCNHIYAEPVIYQAPVSYIEADGSFNERQADFMYWRQLWQPTQADIENLIAGRGMWLELHCAQLVPVAMYTRNEDGSIVQPEFDKQLTPE